MKYVSGDCVALVTSDLVLLTPRSHLAVFDELREAPASVSRVLEILGRGGLGALPPFACVALETDQARIVVAGEFSVVIDDGVSETVYDGSDVTTWTEKFLGDVSGSMISVCGPPSKADVDPLSTEEFPITNGVVLASRVTMGSRLERPSPIVEPASEAPSKPTDEPSFVAFEDERVENHPDQAPAPTPELPPEEIPQPDGEDDAEPQASDPDATKVEGDDVRFDAMFGKTVQGRRPEDAAVRQVSGEASTLEDRVLANPSSANESVAEPEPDKPGDHDGHTMSAAQVAALRAKRAGEPNHDNASPDPDRKVDRPPRRRGILKLSTGESVALDRAVYLGRAPQARNTGPNDLPTLVVLDNPYVSSTHIEIGFEGDDLIATDVSTNGSMMTRPGKQPERLRKGVPTLLVDQTVLTFADDLTAYVELEAGHHE